MKYWTRCTISGDKIDWFYTKEEALEEIEKYEEQDKRYGYFEPDFYEVYEEGE